jgi:hypothetical protein
MTSAASGRRRLLSQLPIRFALLEPSPTPRTKVDFEERRPAVVDVEAIAPLHTELADKCVGTISRIGMLRAMPTELRSHPFAARPTRSATHLIQIDVHKNTVS